jgi:BMFP domain-containing protein YqiC
MKTSMMRTPLIKSAAVLIVLVLLAYLTSASPEGGVLNSLGLIIIGAFRFVQWAIAMVIGIAVSIAFLIAIFLFAVSLVNKESASTMYAAVKVAIAELCQPALTYIGSLRCRDNQCQESQAKAPKAPALPPPANDDLKEDLKVIISDEVLKVTDRQQALNEQLATLTNKIAALEAKTADFAAAAQLEAIASDIAATGEQLAAVKNQVAELDDKINASVNKLEGLSADKILGDLPARLEQLEQQDNSFDPQPLTEALETLKTEMEEVKKKGATKTPARSRKKA